MESGLDNIFVHNLFKFLCENDLHGTEEEIFQHWVSQAASVPPAESLPICFQMIRNMQNSKVPKELLQKYGKLFY